MSLQCGLGLHINSSHSLVAEATSTRATEQSYFGPFYFGPQGIPSVKNQNQHEFRPMVIYKLNNRSFELSVLRAIFEHESECESLVKMPAHPSSWGWASRSEIAKRIGHKHISKSLSRKIRKAFLWLEDHDYLKHADINEPGMNPDDAHGATRFLIAYWVFKALDLTRRVVSKAFQETSRTLSGFKPSHAKGIVAQFQELKMAEGLVG